MTMSEPVKLPRESALAGEANASATELEGRGAGAVEDVDASDGGR